MQMKVALGHLRDPMVKEQEHQYTTIDLAYSDQSAQNSMIEVSSIAILIDNLVALTRLQLLVERQEILIDSTLVAHETIHLVLVAQTDFKRVIQEDLTQQEMIVSEVTFEIKDRHLERVVSVVLPQGEPVLKATCLELLPILVLEQGHLGPLIKIHLDPVALVQVALEVYRLATLG